MFPSFFQTLPMPSNELHGVYDMRLVLLSYIVASFASFIALDITGRLRDAGNTSLSTTLWIAGGSISMGVGIWSMHFIGMMAFSMPNMAMNYDAYWTGISLLVAIFASAFALFLLKSKTIHSFHLILGGILLGLAIASMHYVGMYAMTISMTIHYLPSLFWLSIVIAILASEAALWLAIKSNQVVMSVRFRLKIVSAVIMGAAICGMHYTGMAAAVFTPPMGSYMNNTSLNPQLLSIGVSIAAFCLLTIAVLASTYKEAQNQKLLATARQAGMAEVAATVLHNVGNVLNSVNVSASLIAEKIDESKLNELDKLNQLFKDHKHDLFHYITNDSAGKELPNYIDMLVAYWRKEREEITTEAKMLIKNIQHIKKIIDMQQTLSCVSNQEQITDLDDSLEEALMISGIKNKTYEITIDKIHENIKPIIVDKVKLLQILVNIINNAKESLQSSNQKNKKVTITITVTKENKSIEIEIIDNGLGIPSNKINNIFSYGFTTKTNGHGFGLHTSALAAKEMGGGLRAKSDGSNQGATFILELPYNTPKK